MGKDLLVSVGVDVEEGEISDSASIEEISAEDFGVKSPPVGTEIAASKNAVDDDSKQQQQQHQQVWTMQDLLKYQNKYHRNYAPGLYNFAWAQAVQNKPLDDYLTTMNTSTPTDNNLKQPLLNDDNNNIEVKKEVTVNNDKDVVDISDDGESEKEEGELEEGEIDLDMEVVNAGKQGGVEDNVEKWINIIRIGLESITINDAKKSFTGVCSRLEDFLDSFSKLFLEKSISNKDDLGHLAFSSIQLVNSVYCSMSQTHKEQNRHLLSRALTNVKNNMSVIFSPEQLKEIEMMLLSCNNSNAVSSNTKNNDKPNNQEVVLDSIPSDQKLKQSESFQPQTSTSKNRVLLPLLDLHKDHDVDSLPSPTRETTHSHSSPLGKPLFVGDPEIRPEWPTPRVPHRYETDALKAVSTYQQKFGKSSFLFNDLPSPTPSEESGNTGGGGDTGGEVSSFPTLQTSNPVTVTVTVTTEPSLKEVKQQGPNVQLLVNPRNAAPVYSTSSSVTRAPNKTRDPRLRVSNPETPIDFKQPAIEPLEGPAQKRLKSGFGESITTTSGLPSTSTVHAPVTGVSSIATSASLQSILKDIAVNPASWMNILNMEQQKSVDNSVTTQTSSSSSSSSFSSIPTSTAGAPPLVQDDVGKVRMKPRDPRRALHVKSLQKPANPKQLDPKVVSSSSSSSLSQPDITRQFTKNLKNIADIVSTTVSAPIQTQPSSQSQPSQPSQQVHSSFVNMKVPPSSQAGRVQNGTGPTSEEVGPSPSLNGWGDVEQFFGRFDDQQRAAIQRERSKRMEEQKKMFAERKLCLVLDLDHTLLNSAKFAEVEPMHDDMLKKKEEQDREKSHRHLFRFPHMCMWTKLRPGIWKFLEKASKLYELHLYTMGNKLYATEMAKVLDPKGVLFNGRVISRGDDGDSDGDPKSKDLEGVLGMESAVVIIDDSIRVWPHNKLNLIVVERYIYFPCSRRQFGLPGPSLLEIDHDERPEDGTLASSLAVIEKIHENFFQQESLDDADVRNILASEQRKILGGCRIVFSRVFPVGEASPHLHPLWQTAEQFGAVCTNQIDEQVTHVVANSLGTDKVNWALATGRPVVHPGWVEASALLYRRANEHDFAVKP
ncbi:hypothetical protein LXL04_025720 [Taraxacum kok-saghyz]